MIWSYFPAGSPISAEDFQSSLRVNFGFLVTSLTKALLAQLIDLARQPHQERVLVVLNIFHFTIIEAWEHSKLYKWFYTLSLTYGLPQFSCGGLQTVYWIHGLVFVLPCNLNCVTLYTQVCSPIQSIHFVTGRVQSRFRHKNRIS